MPLGTPAWWIPLGRFRSGHALGIRRAGRTCADSGGATQLHHREIDLDLRDHVDVVGKHRSGPPRSRSPRWRHRKTRHHARPSGLRHSHGPDPRGPPRRSGAQPARAGLGNGRSGPAPAPGRRAWPRSYRDSCGPRGSIGNHWPRRPPGRASRRAACQASWHRLRRTGRAVRRAPRANGQTCTTTSRAGRKTWATWCWT